ncbi:MAG: hypothetical protein ACP6IS_02960 [Candidatus Asgardarchaeia archaeon]
MVFDALRKLRRKKERTIKLCPVCLSPHLRLASSISGWLVAETYHCIDCGYTGPIYIEVTPEEAEKMIKEIAKSSQV